MNEPNVFLKKAVKVGLGVVAGISFSTIIEFSQVPGLEFLSFFNGFMDIGAFISTIVIGLYLIAVFFKHKWVPSKVCITILLLYILIVLSTIISGATIVKRGILSNIFLVLLFDACVDTEDGPIVLSVLNTMKLLCLLNFLTVIIYLRNGGMPYFDLRINDARMTNTGQYLLGVDNGHIVTLLPLICCDIAEFQKNRKKTALILPAIFILGIFLTFSVTTVLILAGTAILFWICKKKSEIRKILLDRRLFIASLLAFFLFFIIFEGYSIFSNLFFTLFGKDIASSGRARLYPIAISYIQKKWLFGYGYVYSNNWIGGYNSPHNIILDMLLSGGVVGLCIYFSILSSTMKAGLLTLKKDQTKDGCLFFMCAIVAFVFCSMAEGYDTYVSFYLFWWMCLAVAQWDKFEKLL